MSDENETVQVQVRMPRMLRDKLKTRADAIGISLQSYLKMAGVEKSMREDK